MKRPAFPYAPLLLVLATTLLSGAPPPPPTGAYVGYTSPISPPVFRTCVNAYNHPQLPPSTRNAIANFVAANGQISLYHFAIQHNNRNGTVPIPANHAVVQRVRPHWVFENPCGARPVRTVGVAYEVFAPAGGQARIDNQLAWTGCEAYAHPVRGETWLTLDAAIVPIQPNWPAVPAGESVVQIPFANRAARRAFRDNTFLPNRTLVIEFDYTYDACQNPPRLPTCVPPPNQTFLHELTYEARTLDPPAAAATWSTGAQPLQYCSP